jgi:hypothetical protein
VSPRETPATAHELARIGLLSSLPGETLARLAARMRREALAPGPLAIEPDRYYVVLGGMVTVTDGGARRVLQPGGHFPGTAAASAVTPATVVSCDGATYDEFLRGLLSG